MKALADTNPLVSALLRPDGNSGQILTRWRRREFELAISPVTLNELNAVLHRPHIRKKYPLAEEDIENHLSLLRNFAQVAEGALTLMVVTSDPNDNHVLAAAVETNSDCMITGDQHLLELREHGGIQILTPREFLTRLAIPDQ